MTNQESTGRPAQEGVRRLSVAHFLVALVALLVTMPFLEQLKYGDLLEAILITLVLLSAVMAVGGRRRTLIAACVLVTPALVAKWIDHFRPDAIPREFALVTAIAFAGFVVWHLLVFILRAPWVNAEVMCAAVATYLMMALLWAFAFTLAARLVPHSFEFTVKAGPPRSMARFEALYFSLVTLTTVGYGDVVPVSNAVRMLAMLEAMTGLFYVTMLIARLVALYSSTDAAQSTSSATTSGRTLT
jgi:Ion channel